MKKTAILSYHADTGIFPREMFSTEVDADDPAVVSHLDSWKHGKSPVINCVVEINGRAYRFFINWHRQVDIFTRTSVEFLGIGLTAVDLLPELFEAYSKHTSNIAPLGIKALLETHGFEVTEQQIA